MAWADVARVLIAIALMADSFLVDAYEDRRWPGAKKQSECCASIPLAGVVLLAHPAINREIHGRKKTA